MITCPTCEGRKKQVLQVSEIAIGGTSHQAVEITCVVCHGEGEVSEQMAAAVEAHKKIWCRCKESYGARYVPDGQSRQVRKHHWRCNKCGKVTQVG